MAMAQNRANYIEGGSVDNLPTIQRTPDVDQSKSEHHRYITIMALHENLLLILVEAQDSSHSHTPEKRPEDVTPAWIEARIMSAIDEDENSPCIDHGEKSQTYDQEVVDEVHELVHGIFL